MSKILKQVQDINIPYPHKLFLQVEVEDHLSAYDDARDTFLTDSEIEEFSNIHNTRFYKVTQRWSEKFA